MTHNTDPQTAKLNGWHVFGIFGGCFGIIVAVNLFMAFQAVSTFPGLEVSSSYADSQTFDVRREAQDALGWQASVETTPTQLTLTLVDEQGRPVYPSELDAVLTRPTTRANDQVMIFTRGANGTLVAPADIGVGRWRLRMTGLSRGGVEYRHNITFTIRQR